jgi:hypothetical protein
MKLVAHVRENGSIQGLIAIPEGKLAAGLLPKAGVQICEIKDHSLEGNKLDPDQLTLLFRQHTVAVDKAQGKLVRHKS